MGLFPFHIASKAIKDPLFPSITSYLPYIKRKSSGWLSLVFSAPVSSFTLLIYYAILFLICLLLLLLMVGQLGHYSSSGLNAIYACDGFVYVDKKNS